MRRDAEQTRRVQRVTVERDGEAYAIDVDVVGLCGSLGSFFGMLHSVHRLVQRRPDEPAGNEDGEREGGGYGTKARGHGIERATQR